MTVVCYKSYYTSNNTVVVRALFASNPDNRCLMSEVTEQEKCVNILLLFNCMHRYNKNKDQTK